ncbi:MAG: MBL fold metallo-hydrolase [Aliidongia sp.]
MPCRPRRADPIREGEVWTPVPAYEVFALRYATREARRSEHFIGGDPHDAPMPMDYFVWLIRGAGRVIAVDCGFTAEVAAQRGRNFLRCPVDALALLGVEAGAVQDLVLTHLHYDHVVISIGSPRRSSICRSPICILPSGGICGTATSPIPSRSRISSAWSG